MTLSVPSAFAAETSADIPPPPAADVCLDQSTDPAVLDEPHAATSKVEAATMAKRPNLCKFIPLLLPNDGD